MASSQTMTINRILSDIVMVVVHCPKMDAYIMSHHSTGWSIPNQSCTEGSWLKEATSLFSKMFGTSVSNALELKKTFRIWHTDNSYLNALVFYVQVEDGLVKGIQNADFEAKRSNEIQELTRKNNLSPEALDILGISSQEAIANSTFMNFVELTKDDLICPKSTNNKLDLFINSEITESDQMALYTCYIDLTFPYLKMNESLMSSFMGKMGLIPFTSDHFRSADIHNIGCVGFREVLGFIATLKGSPKERAGAGERRKFVFRYYDKNRDEKLSADEFEAMLNEIASTKPNLNDNKLILNSIKQEFVTLDDFSKMVDTHTLRGVSTLLVHPAIPLAMKNVRSRSVALRATRDFTISQKLLGLSRPSCSLGCHVVTINPDGRVVTAPIQIDQAANDSTVANQSIVPSTSSMEIFDASSPANNVISALSFFRKEVLSVTDDQDRWFHGYFSDFPQYLKDCCNQAKQIFESEPRMLRIDSPVYIIGDVHGRYSDVMNFQKHFWNFGIECCPGSVLFLGDYVDRGKNSVEVIAYLLAQKVRNRTKIFLLRGNHETRKVQKDHTFYNECLSKFEGAEIWEVINETMDRMPLAALIDNEVFCCHGGIPMPSQCETLDDINEISCPLPNPVDNKLAWALLWNDPQKLGCNSDKAKKLSNGFSKNSRRKTGHTFDRKALNFFIEKHKLSYVVRAHEVQDAGFQIDLDNRLITVFSSSNYRRNNHSGCVLVQKNKLRIFTIPPLSTVEAPTQTDSN